MATLAELRARSETLFTELLEVQEKKAPARRRAGAALAGPTRGPAGATFSWFDPADAVQAAALSFRLAALTGTKKRVNDALAAALDHADEARTAAHPELVRQGLAMFVTHNRDGRRLAKPRTVVAAPGLFRPPAVRASRGLGISIGGAAPGLDYWREDALANEHHQHWHEVYPFSGLPPRDFREWLTTTPRSDIAAVLEGLSPGGNWAARVQNATVTQLSSFFSQTATGEAIGNLAPPLYRLLFKLNDRQGELFFYMHEQMLARYDAELISHGLSRVGPFGPGQWSKPIPEGHDPTDITGFTRREPNQRLGASAVSTLRTLEKEITDAITAGSLRGSTAAPVAIDRTNLGEAAEAAVRQLRDTDPNAYRGLHNIGHGRIAALAVDGEGGVMNNPVAAIRDQVFWRWHKHIDDLNADWQNRQAPADFRDGPPVLMRNGLAAGSTTAWASPDIILCRTADLPATGQAALGERLFGGAAWDTDFTAAGQATAGGTTVPTVSELTTSMGTVPFRGRPVRFLTHEPFSHFLRLENTSSADCQVTVRIFLAPSAPAGRDRRTWIEMDKFLLTVPGSTRLVAYRADSESSVVKRPVDTSPAEVLGGGSGPDEDSYCDCGWPYTLLLPRGTTAGLPFRLMVLCSDAALDRVPAQAQCGSMSWCGAVDRYPDTRDMGYPFARPFAGSAASAIRDTIVRLPHAAARTLTIRHRG